MKILMIVILLAVVCFTCHGARNVQFNEQMSAEEIVRLFSRSNNSSNSLKTLRKPRHFIDCGPPAAGLKVSWKPEVIVTGEDVTIFLSMTPVTSLVTGDIHFAMYKGSSTKGESIIEIDVNKSCVEAREFLSGLECPVKKGIQLKIKERIEKMNQLPPDEYSAKISIRNEHGEMFLCMILNLEVKTPE